MKLAKIKVVQHVARPATAKSMYATLKVGSKSKKEVDRVLGRLSTKPKPKKQLKALKKQFLEPTPREQRLLDAFGGIGKVMRLTDLGDIAYKRERPHSKRLSWARNNIRRLLANGYVRRLKSGAYKRVER